MKNLLLVIFALLLFGCVGAVPLTAPAAPEQLPIIGGTLSGDLVLDGHYLLTADLQVPAGITLTIKPGTIIFIEPSDSTKIDPEFLSREVEVLVRGSLRAIGTPSRPIVIKPRSADQHAILWSGLQLLDSEQVHLEHLRLEQAEGGPLCINASPLVKSLQVVRSRYGVLLQQRSAPSITDSLLLDGEAGLFCWDQSAPQIRNSSIIGQQEEGLYLGRGCRGLFTGLQIKDNDRGVVLPAGMTFDSSNWVSGNRQDFLAYPREAD